MFKPHDRHRSSSWLSPLALASALASDGTFPSLWVQHPWVSWCRSHSCFSVSVQSGNSDLADSLVPSVVLGTKKTLHKHLDHGRELKDKSADRRPEAPPQLFLPHIMSSMLILEPAPFDRGQHFRGCFLSPSVCHPHYHPNRQHRLQTKVSQKMHLGKFRDDAMGRRDLQGDGEIYEVCLRIPVSIILMLFLEKSLLGKLRFSMLFWLKYLRRKSFLSVGMCDNRLLPLPRGRHYLRHQLCGASAPSCRSAPCSPGTERVPTDSDCGGLHREGRCPLRRPASEHHRTMHGSSDTVALLQGIVIITAVYPAFTRCQELSRRATGIKSFNLYIVPPR